MTAIAAQREEVQPHSSPSRAVHSMRVRPYLPEDQQRWDSFVDRSKTGVFLFRRAYMEYHRDRFADGSVIVTDEEGTWVAILPANRRGEVIASHDGLTFGGLLSTEELPTPAYLRAFEAIVTHLKDAGFKRFVYRPTPYCYHRRPAQEDLYALVRAGAVIDRRSLSTVIDLGVPYEFQTRRERGARKALRAGITVGFSDDLQGYWGLLQAVLAERHGARPVHALDEMMRLRASFPEGIRLCIAQASGELLAGVLLYDYGAVARTQYIAANPRGRADGALDLLLSFVIQVACRSKRFVDFGTSHNGDDLNVGLIEQKEGFGGRTVVNDQYALDLTAYQPGQIAAALNQQGSL
jgi:hypothetical protein